MRSFAGSLMVLVALNCGAQEPVRVKVDLGAPQGAFTPIYSWFGYDESNYSTTRNGRALLRELHDLSPVPVNIRAHFLLATGDGKPELKWSSTNVYSEDAQARPIYSWTILDQIFDAYAQAGVRPMVELGFMPEALSSHPAPYHIPWPQGAVEGWSFPPKDYARWSELVYQVAAHLAQRYGKDTVADWYWEVWNEPDISYWHGTEEEYNGRPCGRTGNDRAGTIKPLRAVSCGVSAALRPGQERRHRRSRSARLHFVPCEGQPRHR